MDFFHIVGYCALISRRNGIQVFAQGSKSKVLDNFCIDPGNLTWFNMCQTIIESMENGTICYLGKADMINK